MCYPKPGPRCSAYAAAKLTKAKLDNRLAPNSLDNPVIRQQYLDSKEALAKAEAEYDTTPAGIKELERRVRDYSGSQRKEYALRLERGKTLRNAMLDAVKSKDEGDIKHLSTAFNQGYSNQAFLEDGEHREQISLEHPDTKTMIAESREWTNKLTPDEIEAASWFTSNGAGAINAHLVGKTDSTFNYSKKVLDKGVADLDSAMSKWKREKPIVVYRGLNSDFRTDSDGNFGSLEEMVDREFPVGGVYSSPTFQSSSIDPKKAAGFAVSGVTLEILSTRAAPVMNISAWSVTEKEMILPREQKYRVVKHIKQAKVGTRDSHYLIQLVEID